MARARILAVDDQRYFRELVTGMLSEEGFEAESAATGADALRILESQDFDVVLTDLVMPGMDGSELLQRIKERDPDQVVIVVTGLVDVQTAVDAMKLGASDYLLKPFDRKTLTGTIEAILQKRRLEAEHARLLEENIEFLGERSLYERALGLFSTLSIEPLGTRLVETLCLETRAQGGVLWLAGDGPDPALELTAARGIVRVAEEPERIAQAGLPPELRNGERTALAPWRNGTDQALFAVLRRDGRLLGLVRLTDKLEGESFDPVDRAAADKILQFAEVAVANALRVRFLERRSLVDSVTGSYNVEFFHDALRNEIEKSSRFGRTFAVLALDFGPREALAGLGDADEVQIWSASVGHQLGRLLRSADLLAADPPERFYVLLAEANALGASVLKRRALRTLEASGLLGAKAVPRPRAAVVTFPADGGQVEGLLDVLDRRIDDADHSPLQALGLERLSLPAALHALARQGCPESVATAAQVTRFLLAETGRRPREPGLLYVVPGAGLAAAVRQGLEALRHVETRTDLVVVADGERPPHAVPEVTWVPAARAPGLPPCLVHYGDGPAYAMVREEGVDGQESRLFHSNDRALVEHLALRLQEQLSLPASLGGEARS